MSSFINLSDVEEYPVEDFVEVVSKYINNLNYFNKV